MEARRTAKHTLHTERDAPRMVKHAWAWIRNVDDQQRDRRVVGCHLREQLIRVDEPVERLRGGHGRDMHNHFERPPGSPKQERQSENNRAAWSCFGLGVMQAPGACVWCPFTTSQLVKEVR
jgi:hypothetical protein